MKITKRKIIIVMIFLFLIFISIFLYVRKAKNDFLFRNKQIHDLYVDYNEIQENVDVKLLKYINDKNITMNKPKIVLNPYGTSPLTALVIFYTKDKTSIKLYINDIFVTTVESSNKHSIPIYGLREGYNNKITVIDEFNNEESFYIKTDALNDSVLYEYKSTYETYEHLFINSPKGKYAIDSEGYITWYRDINYNEMDLLVNKNIYFIDKFYRLIETDFMGKVYRMYYTDLFYNNHKIKKLNNNNIMIICSNFSVSEIDYETGKLLYTIDLLDILKKIDENFNIVEEENYINYFQYDENKGSLLMSIRGVDAIINYDLSNKEIIWIFSNNELFSSKFDKYKLNLTIGDYFKGQHTPYLDGNKLYVFDNNNFALSNSNFSATGKSSAVIYVINGMNIKEIYRYGSNYASGWYGSFFEKNGIKNINFGCIVNDDNGDYSKIIELDKNNNIITELTTKYDELLVYESFRDKFYNEKTTNYLIDNNLLVFETEELSPMYYLNDKNINYNGFKEKLKNAIIDESLVKYSTTGFYLNTVGKVEVLFVDKNYDYYNLEIEYTEESSGLSHYIWSSLVTLKGKYAVYIKINDKYYNTNFVFNII